MVVTGRLQCSCGEPAPDRDGRFGGEEASIHHGRHKQTRSGPIYTHRHLCLIVIELRIKVTLHHFRRKFGNFDILLGLFICNEIVIWSQGSE